MRSPTTRRARKVPASVSVKPPQRSNAAPRSRGSPNNRHDARENRARSQKRCCTESVVMASEDRGAGPHLLGESERPPTALEEDELESYRLLARRQAGVEIM